MLTDFSTTNINLQTRRKSSVVFYQPDEATELKHTSGTKEDGNNTTPKQKMQLKLKMPSKSLESVDSGVKSNEDDEIRPPAVRKKSRVSLYSLPSSPAFEISTFDELFQTGGETKLYLHRAPIYLRQPSFRRKSTIDSPLEEFNELDTDDKKNLPIEEETRSQLKRQDTVMSQSFKSLIYTSWQSTKGFHDYRQRAGNAVHHKYCMCCRIESTLFVFMYVVYGMALTCAGVIFSIDCDQELMLSVYLIANGLLSVFVFPILVSGWPKRIGGCINDREEVGSGAFWIGTLILRALFAGLGTFIAFYRQTLQQPWENPVCFIEFSVIILSAVLEWAFLFFVIVVPICICGMTYVFAPSWGSYYDL